MREILLRFDTEDFLTPASDDALGTVLDALDAVGARATLPLVGEKLRALEARGRGDLIARLRSHDVGYHSDTHSVHPTIAEELEPLGWEAAVERFRRREGRGAECVRAVSGRLACYTQPGGNWVAQAGPALRRWGCPLHYGEGWNAYVDLDGVPFFFGGVLHWSAPVAAPKPFLSRLPQVLDPAVEQALAAGGGPAPVNVVAHPTELCTTAFWDAVNWGGGASPPPERWRPAPLRPAAETEAAGVALVAYLRRLHAAGFSFLTATDLVRRHPDRAQGLTLPASVVLGWPAGRWTTAPGLAVSAAESFAAAVAAHAGQERVTLRGTDGPAGDPPADAARGPASAEALLAGARWARDFIAAHDRVPDAVPLGGGWAEPASFHAALASGVLRPCAVAAARHVRPAAALHWDWPIFPAGFAAPGLRAAAVRQAWTMKPAVPATAIDPRGPWSAAA